MAVILLGALIICTLECCSQGRKETKKDFDILDDFKFSDRKHED